MSDRPLKKPQKPGFFSDSTVGANALVAPTYSQLGSRFLLLGEMSDRPLKKPQKPGFFSDSTVGANALVAPTYSPQKPGFFAWGLRNRVSFLVPQ
ncbi:hypothetical protein [Planktothricoides raciborskii]|uniref:Uncharacterized protein n=1 Tax=Planktothricoides raciborskii GIHE-MW2 TaxID=2792601 RepID=A0AAU8J8B6_9CYAN